MAEYLTYREAARLVGRKRRAIQYWRARGMPMSWAVRQGQKVRVVEKTVLQEWFRERVRNDPVQQARIRAQIAALQAAQGATHRVPNQS